MRYLPKSPAERVEMLDQIGAKSIDDLFGVIPAEYRLTRDLDIPRQMAESEIIDYFKQAGQQNATGYASFLGAGCYPPLPARRHRLPRPARRIPHQLHSLPGRNHPGNPPGHL